MKFPWTTNRVKLRSVEEPMVYGKGYEIGTSPARFNKRSSRLCLIAAFTAVLLLGFGCVSIDPRTVQTVKDHATAILDSQLGSLNHYEEGQVAFATFVSGFNETAWQDTYKGDSQGGYFDGARLINYQLQHSPSTRSRPNIPVIALVSEDVSDSKRDLLESEGMTVVEGKYLTPEWVSDAVGAPRWKNVMIKLHLAEMTQYSKICFIDADTMIYSRLDGIFNDPATKITRPKGAKKRPHEDGVPLPSRYMFAGVTDKGSYDHPIPPDENDPGYNYFNAGFFCLHPSEEIYSYYLTVLNRKNSFFPVYPEQNMLNMIHGADGTMPWQHLDWKWNTNFPTWKDLDAGVKTLHSKLWMADDEMPLELEDRELHHMWWYQKREMDSYFYDRNNPTDGG